MNSTNALGKLGIIFGLFVLVMVYSYDQTAGVYLSILTLVLLFINKTSIIEELMESNK